MKYIRNFLLITFAFLSFAAIGVQAQTPQNPIERKIFKEILTLPRYGVFDHIGYKLDGSTVTLYGKTHSLGTKKSAERVVKRIDGVERVINNIEELPPSGFDDSIRRQLVGSFWNNGGALYRYLQGNNPSVRLIVENGRVTLEGYVANKGDARLAYLLANQISNVFSVQNNLIVERGESR